MQGCLAADKVEKRWYLDSGCSRHITGNVEQFITLESKKDGVVTYGDNGKGFIIGKGKIYITPSTFIENVLLVNGLKHNLLSISQFCDKGLKVTFEASICIITNPKDNSIVLMGHRHGNIYMVDLHDLDKKNGLCLITNEERKSETSWLWHRRLGHASMDLISKLVKKDLIKDVPKLIFEKDKICGPCSLEK